MTKKVLLGALLVALIAMAGCKSSNTANDAKRGDPVVVLDAGKAPQAPLRYKIAHGTATNSVMDFGIASLATTRAGAELAVTPGVRLYIVSGPTMKAKRGTRFDVRIVKAEAIIPAGIDPDVAKDLNNSAAVLNNVGGWVEVDDRGIIQRTQLNEAAQRSDVPVRLLVMLINARTSLARVILPAEPVGVGARWEARKDLILYGFEINQVDTYTLTDKVGDQLKIAVRIQQTAEPQTLTFDEEGVEISLESFGMTASGEVIANLNALEASAAASGDSTGVLNVKTVEGSERIEIDREFKARMTVTYDLPEASTGGAQE